VGDGDPRGLLIFVGFQQAKVSLSNRLTQG